MLLIKKKKKGDLGGRLKAQRRKLNAKGYKPGRFLKPSWFKGLLTVNKKIK
jgi:hypothetical protein